MEADLLAALTPQPECRFCGCRPDVPCARHTGREVFWLTRKRDVCMGISCQHALAVEPKRLAREKRDTLRRLVTPIAQRAIAANRQKREERERAAKRMKRRTA